MSSAGPRSHWTAFATPAQQMQCKRIVASVVRDLEACQQTGAAPPMDGTLAMGDAGIALFWAYTAKLWPEFAGPTASWASLEAAAVYAQERPLNMGLFSGFTGIAWASAHVEWLSTSSRLPKSNCSAAHVGSVRDADPEPLPGSAMAAPSDLEVPGDDVADALQGFLRARNRYVHYDLGAGSTGAGVFALHVSVADGSVTLLQHVVDHLTASAIESADGPSWWTPHPLLPAAEAPTYSAGATPLGVAHGAAGPLAVLFAVPEEIVSPAVQQLRQRALRRFLAAGRRQQNGPAYARYEEARGLTGPAGLSWCWGDLGIACVLARIGAWHEDDAALEQAILLGRRALEISPEHAPTIRDGSLCHGSAGVMHMFGRLYQYTGLPEFADGARTWLNATYRLWQPGTGDRCGGFQSLVDFTPDGRPDFQPVAGLLTGSAGIALALMAACTDCDPSWDQAFLLSAPSDSASTH